MAMRPRFSLKWLLICFTVASVVLYVIFIRPTAIAERFVSRVENRDFDAIQPLSFHGQSFAGMLGEEGHTLEECGDQVLVKAELEPRTWEDFFDCQRRISLEVSAERSQWRRRSSVVASVDGLQWIENEPSIFYGTMTR